MGVECGGATGQVSARIQSVTALMRPVEVQRFGGLSLGVSTHLVDEVSLLGNSWPVARVFLKAADGRGRLTLPVWVDHVGSGGTRYAVGDLAETVSPPLRDRVPLIQPR